MKNWLTIREYHSFEGVLFHLADDDTGYAVYEAGHLPGALFITLEEDLTGTSETGCGRHPLPDMNRFADAMMQSGVSADTPILVYGEALPQALARMWWMLKAVGVDRVQILYDPADEWKRLPLETGKEVGERAPGHGLYFREEMHVLQPEVRRIRETGEAVLIDSRDSNRFNGIEDLLDGVPGHIPGALSYPYDHLLQKDAPALEEIRAHFAEVPADRPIVVYCGSGVSAPWNMMMLEEIGIPSRLYPGSYSDWVRNPDNDIEP